MSTLGEAIGKDLAGKIVIDQARIEKILVDSDVSSTVSRGTPAQLRIRHLEVTGTKKYAADGGAPVTSPINLNWSPGDGVNGVGSEANLRGKSSVVHLCMWVLTGRSHLQEDVTSWVDHVSAEIQIDGVSLFVEFDVNDTVPSGTVEKGSATGRTVLGRFSDDAGFEELMGSVMLGRLRLDVIPVFADGIETAHTWPSYASALTVRADKLDPIIGNENTLKTRILQMFVGTSWAAVDAQVTTALRALQFKQDESAQVRPMRVSGTVMEAAENRVAAAKAAVDAFDPSEPNVDAVFEMAALASERGRVVGELELQLMTAGAAFTEARSQLRAEQRRERAVEEDAVAKLLFHGMKPTACPRCTTAVSPERYKAEASDHHCSLCDSNLVGLETSSSTDATSIDEDVSDSVNGAQGEDDVEESEDPLVALASAVADAEEGVGRLREAHQAAERGRVEAEEAARQARASLDQARRRTQAEQELIGARAALDALEALGQAEGPGLEPSAENDELIVLESAKKLVATWVKDDQDPLLERVSEVIAGLARRFGVTNLTSVTLKGNGNMRIDKGGVETGYSTLTNGEKLRIKLATAIALIQIGHQDGVGRHPGLLFVDSPAAEEIPETDLRTMLEVMTAVAEETDLQMVVATTHGPMLSDVLDDDHLLVATGDDFVW